MNGNYGAVFKKRRKLPKNRGAKFYEQKNFQVILISFKVILCCVFKNDKESTRFMKKIIYFHILQYVFKI